MKKILIVLSLIFIGCEKEEIRPFPCLDGNCGYQFAVDTISSPGAKLSPDGYWRVKHNGINYFTIRGLISQLHPVYVVNKVPMVETKYDSDYWIVFDTIQFSTPMYGYMGWFNDQTLNNPIPMGNHVFTINYLKSITSIFNKSGSQNRNISDLSTFKEINKCNTSLSAIIKYTKDQIYLYKQINKDQQVSYELSNIFDKINDMFKTSTQYLESKKKINYNQFNHNRWELKKDEDNEKGKDKVKNKELN